VGRLLTLLRCCVSYSTSESEFFNLECAITLLILRSSFCISRVLHLK